MIRKDFKNRWFSCRKKSTFESSTGSVKAFDDYKQSLFHLCTIIRR